LSVETRRSSGYGPRAMGLLDIPRGIVSRLPLIGGSSDSDDSDEETPKAPVDESPDETVEEPAEDTEPDEPDEVEDPDEDTVEDDEPSEDPDGPAGEAEEPAGSDSDEPKADSEGKEDISGTTAPSIGPNTVIEKESPEERLSRHEQSNKDAMGLDKRREVIGGNYNASFGKQVFRWAAVVVVVIAAAFGAKLLVADLDKAPAHAADKAPWSGTDKEPAPLQ
jgi:hypothetical protein